MRNKNILFYLIMKILFEVMPHYATADDDYFHHIFPKRMELMLCIQSDHSVFEEEDCYQKKEKRFAFSIAYESETRHE